MSEENAPESKFPEFDSLPEQPTPAPRVRRISNPRVRRKSDPAPETEPASENPDGVGVESPQVETGKPAVTEPETESAAVIPGEDGPSIPVIDETGAEDSSEWPDPETVSAEGGAAAKKRKRRRKKKSGGEPQAADQTVAGEQAGNSSTAAQPAAIAPVTTPYPPRPQQQRPQLDPEVVAKCAWKIYLSEVSEEGVALVNDHDARELSRRCFRLAEIFHEEQARRGAK